MTFNKNIILFVSTFFVLFILNSCLVIENQFSGLPPGEWRAVLMVEGVKEVPDEDLPFFVVPEIKDVVVKNGQLPFNFEVVYETDNPEKFHIEISNGEERIIVNDISMGWDHRIGKDTIIINFPIYESYIKGIYAENVIQGDWVVTTKENYRIPFIAKFGENHRFAKIDELTDTDLAGKWEVTFGVETDEPFPAIGEFKQDGNQLSGTFLTETGDYRYLEGTVHDKNLFLSCFDGAHAFLFEAKLLDDNTLTGIFRSGKHYKTLWTAKRNPDAQLRDANTLTFLKEGYDKFAFNFKNTEGKEVSLEDEVYKGKVKLVQIMGTWCPNCRDESNFLIDYLSKNKLEDLKVIALGFEKHEEEKNIQLLKKFKKSMGIPYEVLAAGSSDKLASAAALPMLNHIMSYPTMIFIDKEDQVRKIHTGFAGPATSEFIAFEKDFDEMVKMLLAE